MMLLLVTATPGASEPLSWWGFFVLFVLLMIVADMKLVHNKPRKAGLKEALAWSALWIAISLTFSAGVYQFLGAEKGLQFLTGYLVEKAMSVDNIFAFILLFRYFRVDAEHQHRVLFWGIIGALVFRAIFIVAGVA